MQTREWIKNRFLVEIDNSNQNDTVSGMWSLLYLRFDRTMHNDCTMNTEHVIDV